MPSGRPTPSSARRHGLRILHARRRRPARSSTSASGPRPARLRSCAFARGPRSNALSSVLEHMSAAPSASAPSRFGPRIQRQCAGSQRGAIADVCEESTAGYKQITPANACAIIADPYDEEGEDPNRWGSKTGNDRPHARGRRESFTEYRPSTMHLQPLTYGKNDSFSIPEPRRLRAATSRDAVDGLDPRHVVFFKLHASRFQCGDFGRNILHRPEGSTGLRRAGADGWIHEHP